MDKQDKGRELAEKLKIPFPLLSDADHKIIDSYDLYNAEGKISKPATYVLDGKRIIRWAFFAEDYKVRPLDDVILEELKKIS